MDNPCLVGGVHRPGQGFKQLGRSAHGHRLIGKLLLEVAAVDKLLHEIGTSLVFANFVNCDDVQDATESGRRSGRSSRNRPNWLGFAGSSSVIVLCPPRGPAGYSGLVHDAHTSSADDSDQFVC